MTNRDKLRKITLGVDPTFKKEIITYNGQEFEIRQPSIKARAELRQKCIKGTGENLDVDIFEFLVWSVIQNTYVPNSDEKVFDDEDYDTLVSNPTGGFMDTFAETAAKMVNIKVDDIKKS